jgi:hypothetical protein
MALVPKKKLTWWDTAAAVPVALDVANVITQSNAISNIENIKNRATEEETPSISLKVRTPVGMTEQQKIAARSQALATPVAYSGSDFNKSLVASNMRQKNIADTNNAIAFKDAEMYAADKSAALAEENADRQLQYGVASDRLEKRQQYNNYMLSNKVNAVQDHRMLLADVFRSMNITQDENRKYEHGRQQSDQDIRLNAAQQRVYNLQDELAATSNYARKEQLKNLLEDAQGELSRILDTPNQGLRSVTVRSLLGFKNGGVVRLKPRN